MEGAGVEVCEDRGGLAIEMTGYYWPARDAQVWCLVFRVPKRQVYTILCYEGVALIFSKIYIEKQANMERGERLVMRPIISFVNL